MNDFITATFSNAFWVTKDHSAFHVDVSLSNGKQCPFTYVVDGSDDNDGIVSTLTREAYHNGKLQILELKEDVKSILDIENEVRARRNNLLSNTDKYVSVPDYPISETDRNNIIIYRGLLRDITKQEGFPNNVSWPKVPDCIKDNLIIHEQ
jgi:hypothetical protein